MAQKEKFSNENTFLNLVQIENLFWTCSKQFERIQNRFENIK